MMDNTKLAAALRALNGQFELDTLGRREPLLDQAADALEAAEAAHAEVSRDLVWNIGRANTWQSRAEAAEAELKDLRDEVEEDGKVMRSLRRHREEAEAELTRRDTVIAEALGHGRRLSIGGIKAGGEPMQRMLATLAAAPIPLEAAKAEAAAKALEDAASEWNAKYEELTEKSGAYGNVKVRAAFRLASTYAYDRAAALRDSRFDQDTPATK